MFNFFRKKNKIENAEDYYNYLIEESKQDKLKTYGFNEKYANQEERLHKIFGNCDKFNKSIKMILISDTHNCLNMNEFEQFVDAHRDYDVCILLGDHNSYDVEKILKYIDKSKLYGLLGNHDYNYLSEFDINNLNGNVINIKGVNILGIQGSFKYKPSDFPSFTQQESISFLNEKPKVDILVSHDNRFDSKMIGNPAHQGLFGITYYLYKNKVPYHIHGHLHNPYKQEMINGTKEISVYMYEYIELRAE